MQDYEKKAAPLLAQIQQEIAKVREAIEAEEAKIEALYTADDAANGLLRD